jgi:hypothetical protein
MVYVCLVIFIYFPVCLMRLWSETVSFEDMELQCVHVWSIGRMYVMSCVCMSLPWPWNSR